MDPELMRKVSNVEQKMKLGDATSKGSRKKLSDSAGRLDGLFSSDSQEESGDSVSVGSDENFSFEKTLQQSEPRPASRRSGMSQDEVPSPDHFKLSPSFSMSESPVKQSPLTVPKTPVPQDNSSSPLLSKPEEEKE